MFVLLGPAALAFVVDGNGSPCDTCHVTFKSAMTARSLLAHQSPHVTCSSPAPYMVPSISSTCMSTQENMDALPIVNYLIDFDTSLYRRQVCESCTIPLQLLTVRTYRSNILSTIGVSRRENWILIRHLTISNVRLL